MSRDKTRRHAVEVSWVPLGMLTGTTWNPPRRTADYTALKRSIEEIGLQVPILVTADMGVVDGNRRLAACKDLGYEEVPVIVTRSDPRRVYADVNASARHLAGNDILHLWFSEAGALTPNQFGRCQRAQDVLGERLLRKIYKDGYSLKVFSVGRAPAGYCDQFADEFVRAAAVWVMTYGPNHAKQLMAHAAPAAVVIKAVREGRAMKLRYAGD